MLMLVVKRLGTSFCETDAYAAVVFVRVQRCATRASLSSSDASLKAALPKRVDSCMKVS